MMNKNNEFDLFQKVTINGVSLECHNVAFCEQLSSFNAVKPLNHSADQAQYLAKITPECLSLSFAKTRKPDEVLSFTRDSTQDSTFRKLKLGKYDIHARLDLHGFTLEQAREEVLSYLKKCQKMGVRALIIVHGKGERTNPQAQLKSFVSQWLEQIKEVQCFHSTQRHQGGTGALYVLLKKSQDAKEKYHH